MTHTITQQTHTEHSILKEQNTHCFQMHLKCPLDQITYYTIKILIKIKAEIMPSIFSDYNRMKPEINYKKKSTKSTNMWMHHTPTHQ